MRSWVFASCTGLVACGLSVVSTPNMEQDGGATSATPSPSPSPSSSTSSPTPQGQGADGGEVDTPPEAVVDDAGLSFDAGLSVDAGPTTAVDAGVDAGSTVSKYTITGGSFVINGSGGACSTGGDSATLAFRDDGAASYRKKWVAGNCNEKDYGVVSPGNNQVYTTYVGHRWRLRWVSDDSLIVDFTLTAPGSYVVTVH